MKNMVLVLTVISLVCGLPVLGQAKKFISNGYEVELYCKVRGKELAIWGDIEGGRECKRLRVYAHLSNSKYNDSARLSTYIKREHSPTSRSVYKGNSRIRSNKHQKGWFVDKLDVTCTNVNPVN